MDSLGRYLQLMAERPDLFRNSNEPGEIRIIHDPERIRAERDRLQAELRAKNIPEHYIDIGILSEDQWFWVVRDLVQFPDGHIWGYIRYINRKSQESGGTNVVLMCFQDEKVLMIKKYRHEERGWGWEFPRGFGESGLTAEENACKELEEEVGVQATSLTLLTNVQEGQGGTAVFRAVIPSGQKIALDTGEGITSYRWVSMNELDVLVAQGKLSDWFSLWAYALEKARLQNGKSLTEEK